MLSCKEFSHQSSKIIDKAEMSFLDKFNCQLHLFLCKHCRHYHQQSKTVVSVAHHLDCSDASDETIDKAVAQLNTMKQNTSSN